MFDPFDERNRDKQKRRKSSEVEFDRKQWGERVENHFARSLEELQWPEYVKATDLWDCVERNQSTNLPRTSLVRNAPLAMEKLGYEKMLNPRSKDGRWNFSFGPAVVYRKKGSPMLDKWGVKDALGF